MSRPYLSIVVAALLFGGCASSRPAPPAAQGATAPRQDPVEPGPADAGPVDEEPVAAVTGADGGDPVDPRVVDHPPVPDPAQRSVDGWISIAKDPLPEGVSRVATTSGEDTICYRMGFVRTGACANQGTRWIAVTLDSITGTIERGDARRRIAPDTFRYCLSKNPSMQPASVQIRLTVNPGGGVAAAVEKPSSDPVFDGCVLQTLNWMHFPGQRGGSQIQVTIRRAIRAP